MKRRSLCVIGLMIYVLIACTILSLKIEKEMLTQVEVLKVKDKGMWGQSVSIPQAVLFEDARGKHLYELVEGSGWESGLRVREIPQDSYELDHEKGAIRLPGGKDYCFIITASRQLVAGELVEIIETKDAKRTSDVFLFVYPQGVPEDLLVTDGLSVKERSEKAVLAPIENTTTYFLEHKQMGEHQAMTGDGWRIFSHNTVHSFWEQLPLVALLAVLLLSVTGLWVFSLIVCNFTRHPKRVFAFAGAISVASLVAICIILSFIDLPSAMLPDTNILNIRHYIGELEMMLSGLKTLPSALQEFSEAKTAAYNHCAVIVAIGLVLTGIAAMGEWIYIRKV